MHLDTSTFSLHGKYNSDEEDDPEEVITITKGYSKDNKPDLNQVVVSLMCVYRSSIPVWIEALSGNSPEVISVDNTTYVVNNLEPAHRKIIQCLGFHV